MADIEMEKAKGGAGRSRIPQMSIEYVKCEMLGAIQVEMSSR